jgi:hypothetical protein
MSGNLKIPALGLDLSTGSGNQGQVKFPAVQNPSSDANTLDDYEEGTWTPTDASGAGLTFTTPFGIYEKIGRLVVARGCATWPSTANAAAATIGGLPFANAASNGENRMVLLTYGTESTARYGVLANGGTTFLIQTSTAATITNATMSLDLVWFVAIYSI